ncbi:MAG: amidohydrolase [Anaerolineae bacterium]|nr:amidohydrolase [Anaerolineae bacterium]
MNIQITSTDLDRRIWEEELADFVPARVFDAHSHIFRLAHTLDPDTADAGYVRFLGGRFEEGSYAYLDECDAVLFPGRQVNRLSFPWPFHQCDFEASNRYLAEQLAGHPQSAGLMLVHPSMSAEEVESTILRYGFLGVKPYRNYSVTGDIQECRITEFMPEHQLAVVNRHGLIVMLHVSKGQAIADPDNIRDMVELAHKYPHIQWVLAHCARSYSDWAIEKAAPYLRDLPNVWYDTSSVCSSDAFDALYSGVGIERVMYASDDVPVGVVRGTFVTWGYAWSDVYPNTINTNLPHCDGRMTFLRYEQLRAMRRAARRYGATPAQLQDLFCGTAERLVGRVRGGIR